MSLNLCTDQLLVALAPEKVTALSPLARDPALSVVAAQAAALPWVRADAEAVLRLHPDLVLAGDFAASGVVGVLRARGVRVVTFPEATDFPAIAAQTRAAGQVLGVPARAEALVAQMEGRLRAVPGAGRGRSAVMWEARGFTAGPGSLGAAVLRAAGFANAGGRVMGVEAVAASPPDLLVTAAAPGFPSLATEMLWHPAVRGLARRELPAALLACGTPASVGAVELLAR